MVRKGFLDSINKILSKFSVELKSVDESQSDMIVSRRKELRKKAITVLELTKGFTPEQRSKASNSFKTMEELAGYVLELTNDC